MLNPLAIHLSQPSTTFLHPPPPSCTLHHLPPLFLPPLLHSPPSPVRSRPCRLPSAPARRGRCSTRRRWRADHHLSCSRRCVPRRTLNMKWSKSFMSSFHHSSGSFFQQVHALFYSSIRRCWTELCRQVTLGRLDRVLCHVSRVTCLVDDRDDSHTCR